MLSKVILIIDKRVELSTKYKKLCEQQGVRVFCESSISESFKILADYEPDLIFISDSVEKNLAEACSQIKLLSYHFRPVLIVLSKSEHLPDKLKALDAGADDFFSEPIDNEEFKARFNAHIRRHFENNINDVTQLFDSKISFKYLKRLLITNNEPFSAILADIDNFEFYKELYGELAANKMLQTYQAIISSVLDKDDYLGQIGKNDFLIITKSKDVEKMASYFVYAFDLIAEKFYSLDDLTRGYMVFQDENKSGEPIALVSTSIGVVTNDSHKYSNLKHFVNALISTHKLAKLETGSKYIYERPKLAVADETYLEDINQNLLVIESDEALSYLLYVTAQMQGYNVQIVSVKENLFEVLNKFKPAVVVLDAGNNHDFWGIEFCKKIKRSSKYSKIKIILTTILHDKIKIFDIGADVYLPKPYELDIMFAWVKKLTNEYNT